MLELLKFPLQNQGGINVNVRFMYSTDISPRSRNGPVWYLAAWGLFQKKTLVVLQPRSHYAISLRNVLLIIGAEKSNISSTD